MVFPWKLCQNPMISLVWGGFEKKTLMRSLIGVYVGASNSEFALAPQDDASMSGTGSANSITSNRISFCLGMQGATRWHGHGGWSWNTLLDMMELYYWTFWTWYHWSCKGVCKSPGMLKSMHSSVGADMWVLYTFSLLETQKRDQNTKTVQCLYHWSIYAISTCNNVIS